MDFLNNSCRDSIWTSCVGYLSLRHVIKPSSHWHIPYVVVSHRPNSIEMLEMGAMYHVDSFHWDESQSRFRRHKYLLGIVIAWPMNVFAWWDEFISSWKTYYRISWSQFRLWSTPESSTTAWNSRSSFYFSPNQVCHEGIYDSVSAHYFHRDLDLSWVTVAISSTNWLTRSNSVDRSSLKLRPTIDVQEWDWDDWTDAISARTGWMWRPRRPTRGDRSWQTRSGCWIKHSC
jgi:hypothetical protein